jgi:pyruvate dehydrogenase E2 component (dihydrolipoamide acetyltransferase)
MQKPAVQAAPQPVIQGQEGYTDTNVSQIRKVIAKRLAESKFSAPHFYLTMEINMDKAMEARVQMNEVSEVKISFNDMVIKAVGGCTAQTSCSKFFVDGRFYSSEPSYPYRCSCCH